MTSFFLQNAWLVKIKIRIDTNFRFSKMLEFFKREILMMTARILAAQNFRFRKQQAKLHLNLVNLVNHVTCGY